MYETISAYLGRGMLGADSFHGKTVVDLECGLGAGPQIFSYLGAAKAYGIDYYLGEATPSAYPPSSNVEYLKIDFVSQSPFKESVDFIFLSNASEHIKSVSEHMEKCFESLRPGGILFIAHDNYYQPVGHHDHQFLFLNSAGDAVESVARKCWDTSEKCAFSADHRNYLGTLGPQIWSTELDERLSPSNCVECVYFKRSQLWAHLKYQDQFNELYPFPMFRTVDAGYLNKVTIRQIRQFAIEAGFCIDYEERYWLANEPEASLLQDYTRADLTTFQYFLRLRKPGAAHAESAL